MRDEIEMATEKIDVRPRFTSRESVVVEDDSTAAPTSEAQEHLGKHYGRLFEQESPLLSDNELAEYEHIEAGSIEHSNGVSR